MKKFISEKSYQLKLDVLIRKRDLRNAPSRPEDIAEGLAQVTLASGGVEYLEYLIMLRPSREQLMELSLIFQTPAIPIPHEDGGVVLLNPANISMVKIHSAPIESSTTDWPMDIVSETTLAACDIAKK